MKAMRYAAVILCGWALASCTAYQQQAGLIDGVAGAAAGSAAVHENQQRQRDYARYGIPPQEDSPWTSPQTSPPAEAKTSDYPVAQRTDDPDEVLSPYPPHHRINVQGFKSGQMARDPKNKKIFLIP